MRARAALVVLLAVGIAGSSQVAADEGRGGRKAKAPEPPPLDLDACVAWVKTQVQSPTPDATGPTLDLQRFLFPGQLGQQPPARKLMLFAGDDHKTYLGCLNCPKTETDSIWNPNGPHGNGFGASDSIWKMFSNHNPWSAYVADPPVIVDDSGRYYGKFVASEYALDRTHLPEAVFLLDVVTMARATR